MKLAVNPYVPAKAQYVVRNAAGQYWHSIEGWNDTAETMSIDRARSIVMFQGGTILKVKVTA